MEDTVYKAMPAIEEMKLISDDDICYSCGRSGVGGRKENQDCYGGLPTGNYTILTVCDGMGGMAGGQTASTLAVGEILKTLAKITEEDMDSKAIKDAIDNANRAIYQRALNDPPLRGMGTTATILVLTRRAAYLAHVGDSRIYQLRRGKKIYRTFDHSKVFEMVAQGIMTEEQARQSSFSNIITRALGIKPQVDCDVQKLPYKKGDRFVLCCDGVWNVEPEPEILKLLVADKSPDSTIIGLTDYVNKKGFEGGNEYDNLTAIIADMKRNSDYQYSIFHHIKKCFSKVGGMFVIKKKNK